MIEKDLKKKIPISPVATVKSDDVDMMGNVKPALFQRGDLPVSLQPHTRNSTYFKMGLNSTIASVLNLNVSLFLTIEWKVRQKSETKSTTKKMFNFYQSILEDMDNSWLSKIENVGSILQYGWCAFEIVLKRRPDGYVGIKDLVYIPQHTLRKWDVDSSGDVVGLVQRGNEFNNFQDIKVPIEKLLIFTNAGGGDSPEGKSILIGAYEDWVTYSITEEVLRTSARRGFVGIPIVKIPGEILEMANALEGDGRFTEAQITDAKRVYNEYKSLINDMSYDEQAGVIIASDHFLNEAGTMSSVPCYSIELLSLSGQPLLDINAVRTATEAKMARVMQGDFLQMGLAGKSGSYSLGETRYAMFARSVNVIADKIVSLINDKLFVMIAKYNGFNTENLPQFYHTEANPLSLKEKIEALAQYQYANGQILPDNNVDQQMRRDLELSEEINRPEGWKPEWQREEENSDSDTDNQDKQKDDNPGLSGSATPGKTVNDTKKQTRPTKK